MKRLILSGALALALGLTSAANAQDPLFRIFLDESGNAGDAAPHPGSGTLSYGNPELAPGGGRLYIYAEFQAGDQTVLSPNFDITIDGGTITGAWNYNGPGQDTLTGDNRWDAAAPNPLINPGGNNVSFTAANLINMGLKNGVFADIFDGQHDNTRGDGDTLLGYIDVEAPGAASVWLTVGQQGFAVLGGGPDSPIAFGYGDSSVPAGDVGVRTQIAEATVGGCLPYDMNYDGFPSIIGDVPPFVDCVYFGTCNCPGLGCDCPGDCNCDGFVSIIGDVPCFVDCLYFGNCEDCDPCSVNCLYFGNCVECLGRSGSPGEGDGFTIGGAVYEDEANPLASGLRGITVNILDGERRTVASTKTGGTMGLWRIDNVPNGGYTVVFTGGGAAISQWRESTKIAVSSENKAANQSIQLTRTQHGSKRPAG